MAPTDDLKIEERLAAFEISHETAKEGCGEFRRFLSVAGKPLGLMDAREACNLLDLLERK